MSQAGIVDIEGSHPQIPTSFVTNNGTAIPIVNTLEILGTVVAAHSIPLETTGSGNTVTIQAQYASAAATSVATNAGIASFNSADFSVDANGFVSFTGSVGAEAFTVDASTAPGTNPVTPNGSGIVTVTGGQVAAGTTTNVIRTDSLAANTYTIQIQRSQAVAASTIGDNGVSHFNSTYFTVDSNGFVSIVPSAVGSSFTVDANTAPGTNPVLPNGSGNITVTGGQVAAGTTPNVIRTDSVAANTYTIQIQRSQAVASSTVGDNGVSHFNSTFFTVDSNGFVSLNGAAVGETITGNSGGALSPTAGNWNILGTSTAAGTTPVQTSGSGSTLTVQVQKAQAIASTNATNVGLAAFNSANFTVDANGFVSLIPSSVTEAFMVDAFTAPGTNPVQPNVSGIVTVTGGQVAAGTTTNVIRTDSLAVNTYTIQIQRSQAVASSTIGDNGVSHFNSADFSVDANGFVSLTGSVALTFDGDTGSATPSGGIITFNANANSGSSVKFSASGAQVNLNVTDSNSNTIIGNLSGNSVLFGTVNSSLGASIFQHLTSGHSNSCIGDFSMNVATTSSNNSCCGANTLESILSGNFNFCGGFNAGVAYTSSESYNIMIANEGVIGESNVTRIGTQFAGGTGQNICYIAGITGATPVSAHTPQVVLCDSIGNVTTLTNGTTGQGLLITAGIPAWGGVVQSITGTPNRINIGGTATNPTITISPTFPGLTSIITVGIITTGTWNANTITVPNGGTGDVSFTAYAPICGGTTSTGVLQSVASVGTAGEVLTSNGPSALPSFQPSSSSGINKVIRQVFLATGSYTYTPSAGMLYADVELLGAGGGGGGAGITSASTVSVGGGGGGGGYCRKVFTAAAIGVSKPVVIGAGGLGGANTGGTGSSGGNSTFGTTLLLAAGGLGGNGTVAGISALAQGGAGNVGQFGDFGTFGESGGVGMIVQSAGATIGLSGQGGSTFFGGGGFATIPNTSATGTGSPSNGGGGAGACNTFSASASTGGNGSDGACIITEYTS